MILMSCAEFSVQTMDPVPCQAPTPEHEPILSAFSTPDHAAFLVKRVQECAFMQHLPSEWVPALKGMLSGFT